MCTKMRSVKHVYQDGYVHQYNYHPGEDTGPSHHPSKFTHIPYSSQCLPHSEARADWFSVMVDQFCLSKR